MSSSDPGASAARFDLTRAMTPFFDRHLMFPLLEFIQKKQIYPEREVLEAKLTLGEKTNMVDYVAATLKKLQKTRDLSAKKDAVKAQMIQVESECKPMLDLLAADEVVARLRNDNLFNMEYLEAHHGFPADAAETLFQYARMQYDIGNYSYSADYLYHVRFIAVSQEMSLNALWGKFASEILITNWAAALEDLNSLKAEIDSSKTSSPLVQLQQRAWLIHWSLYVFFKHPTGRTAIIDMFLQPSYLNTIQTLCPHILRYLVAAVITNKRRRSVLQDLVIIIQQEQYSYRDPIIELIDALYANVDFELAQTKLTECEEVLQNDYFLNGLREEFVESARLFIFETYCKIHQKIDIGMLAEKLGKDQESAEWWIVNLIRNARLDAKIDAQSHQVIMGTMYPSIYEQVLERTQDLSFRSILLSQNIDKKVLQVSKPSGQAAEPSAPAVAAAPAPVMAPPVAIPAPAPAAAPVAAPAPAPAAAPERAPNAWGTQNAWGVRR